MTLASRAAAIAIASLFLTGTAFAQTTPAAPADKSAAPMAKADAKPKKERSAASLQCSTDADSKGLHGKDRKKFMSQCKKDAKAAAAPKAN